MINLEDRIQELEEQLNFYKLIADKTYDWEVFRDHTGKIIYLNDSFEKITGYNKNDILQGIIAEKDVIHPEDLGLVGSKIHQAINQQLVEDLQFRIIRKDGEIRHVNLCANPVFENDVFKGTRTSIRDITNQFGFKELVKANETLASQHKELSLKNEELLVANNKLINAIAKSEENEAHIKTIINTLPDLIWLKDIHGTYLNCNYRFEEFVGAKEKDIVGKNDYNFMSAELADFFRSHDLNAMKSNKPSKNEEEIIFANDGHKEFLETIKTPLYNQKNQLIGVLGIARDITLRKKQEEEIIHAKKVAEENEIKYRQIFENSLDNIFILDVIEEIRFKIIATNPAQRKIIGGLHLEGQFLDEVFEGDMYAHMTQNYKISVSEKRIISYEEEITLENKNYFFYTQLIPIQNQNNSVIRIIGISRNITDSKLAEQKLILEKKRAEENEQNLNEAQQIGNTGSGTYNLLDETATWSENTYRIFGYEPFSIPVSFDLFKSKIHPDDLFLIENSFSEIYSQKAPVNTELRIIVNNEIKWLMFRIKPIFENNVLTTLKGTSTDITERKKMEIALFESEMKFKAISQSAYDAIIMTDENDHITFWNEAAEKIFGYKSEEIMGNLLHALLVPSDHLNRFNFAFDKYKKLSIGDAIGRTLELTALHKNGKIFPVEVSLSTTLINEKKHAVGIVRDVTERKEAEEKLLQSEHRLQEAQRIAHIGSWEWNLLTGETRWSPGNYAIHGMNANSSALTPEALINLIHPDDKERVIKVISEAVEKGTAVDLEYSVYRPDGSLRVLHAIGEVTKHETDGTPSIMVGTNQDITERKLVETKIHDSEEAFKNLVENINDIIFEINNEGIITYTSPSAKKISGFDSKELIGKNILSYLHPDDRERIIEKFYQIREDENLIMEFRLIDRFGEYHWLRSSTKAIIINDKIAGNRGSMIDITQKKKAEDLLKENQQNLILKNKEYEELNKTLTHINNELTKAKELIEASEQKLKFLLRNSYDVLILINEKGEQSFLSDTIQDITGYSIEELTGPIANVVYPEDLEKVAKAWEEAINNKDAVIKVQYRHKHKTKGFVWFEAVAQNFLDYPAINAVVCNVHDITTIKENEIQLNYAQEIANMGSWDFNVKTNVVNWSQGFYKLLQLDASQYQLSLPEIQKMLFPEDRKLFAEKLASVTETNSKINISFRMLTSNNELRWMQSNVVSHFENGELISLKGISIDITDLHLSEIRERNRSTILQMLTDNVSLEQILYQITKSIEEESLNTICAILLLNDETKHLHVNLPNNLPDFFNKTIDDIEVGPGAKICCGQSAFKKEPVFVEDLMTSDNCIPIANIAHKANIKSCWSEPVISVSGKVLGTFTIFYQKPKLPDKQEVEKIKYAASLTKLAIEKINSDSELNKYKEHLEDLVNQRTAELIDSQTELVRAKEAAESANRLKTDFLANISHEIRTPLNAIIGFSTILKEKIENNPFYLEYLKNIIKSSHLLLSLINDILDLSKIEAGKMIPDLQPINLIELINEICNIFTLKASEKNIRIKKIYPKYFPEFIVTDEKFIRQILFNLIGNAIKFTLKGEVILELNILSQNNNSIDFCINIIDTGIGIPENELNNIFEPFIQVKQRTINNFEGTGLGLAITKRLTEALEGKVTVSSHVGKGSIFSLTFHNIPNEFRKNTLKSNLNLELFRNIIFRNPKILIAEDEISSREIIKGYLANYNVSILEANNGSDCMRLVQKIKPDLILLDIKMSYIEGEMVLEILKYNPNYKSIPIFIITASTDYDISNNSSISNELLLKPFEKYELIEKMTKYLPYDIINKEITNTIDSKLSHISENKLTTDLKIFLTKEYLPSILQLQISLNFDSLINLNQRLKIYAKQNKIEIINTLCDQLSDQIATFDIEKIYISLKSLVSIIEDNHE